MKKYLSKSVAETKTIGAKLANEISHGIIALSGELGSGKTTFVQGFAEGLGIKEKIISPTFVLIRQHQIPNTDNLLYHIDLYRLDDHKQFKSLGLEELINDSNNLLIIEWAEKSKGLPKNAVRVTMEKKGENIRLITVT